MKTLTLSISNFCAVILIVLLNYLSPSISLNSANFELIYKWQYINYTWPDYETYSDAIKNELYIPENVVMVGIKIYKNTAYIASPRLRSGVPATITSIVLDGQAVAVNKLLTPYPNWHINSKINDCSTLQSVMSFEIDENGIMWVIDGVRTNNESCCPCKLILFDLERNGTIVHTFTFSNELCSNKGGFLNDIVLDKNFAYISENSADNSGLIVYSREQNVAWKLKHKSMLIDPSAANYTVDGTVITSLSPINGIALSPKSKIGLNKTLYYCAQTAYNLYSIDTDIIKNISNSKVPEGELNVKTVGKKQSQSGGITMDNIGNLYYTLLPLYGIGAWNIHTPFNTSKIIYQNKTSMIWPDSFSFDSNGYLYLLASSMNEFLSDKPKKDLSKFKFNLFRVYTGTKSYINNE